MTKEEFAEKYCSETTYMGKSNTKLILVSNKNGFLSDLNALIEAKIEARMPTGEEIEKETATFLADMVYEAGFVNGCEWFRSRMKG
jgi:hypothetical protein